MENYQSIFKRYEKKYLIDEQQYEALLERLGDLVSPDAYGETTVMNLYYDTPDYRIITRSLEKPVYKEKLRIRTYGVPSEDTTAFLELKKKFKGVVYKRRIALPYTEVLAHMEEGQPFKTVTQIGKEIDYFRKMYPDLERGMVIIYERTAYAGTDFPDLRITFDANIRFRDRASGCDLTAGSDGKRILEDGQRIMEIKVPLSMPLPLVRILRELKIYPHTFSKYGQAYRKWFRERNTEDAPEEKKEAVRENEPPETLQKENRTASPEKENTQIKAGNEVEHE